MEFSVQEAAERTVDWSGITDRSVAASMAGLRTSIVSDVLSGPAGKLNQVLKDFLINLVSM